MRTLLSIQPKPYMQFSMRHHLLAPSESTKDQRLLLWLLTNQLTQLAQLVLRPVSFSGCARSQVCQKQGLSDAHIMRKNLFSKVQDWSRRNLRIVEQREFEEPVPCTCSVKSIPDRSRVLARAPHNLAVFESIVETVSRYVDDAPAILDRSS